MSADVVRRLVNLVGFEIDAAGYKRAEAAFDRLMGKAAAVEKQAARSLSPKLHAASAAAAEQAATRQAQAAEKAARAEVAAAEKAVAQKARTLNAADAEQAKLQRQREVIAAKARDKAQKAAAAVNAARAKEEAAAAKASEAARIKAANNVERAEIQSARKVERETRRVEHERSKLTKAREAQQVKAAAAAGKQMDMLGLTTRGVMGLFAAQWVVNGLKRPIEMASDATETLNLLNVTFGESTGSVLRWADASAQAAGRSRYLMRQYAGDFGAFLKPSIGQGEDLNEMAVALADRVVDLASFRNISEKAALEKMRAGLAGETEPLRQLGVDVSVAALEEYAKAQGKNIKALDKAQLMQMRYQLIMAKTADADGDAAKTADEYANSSKALGQAMTDLGTDIGKALLPNATKLLSWMRSGVEWARDLTRDTNGLEAAFSALGMVLGGAAAFGVAKFVAANAPLVLTIGGVVLGFSALVLLLSEVNALFNGGKSILGEYMDKIGGLGTADQFVEDHKEGVKILGETWDSVKTSFGEFIGSIGPGLDNGKKQVSAFVDDVFDLWNKLPAQIRAPFEWVGRSASAANDMEAQRQEESNKAWDALADKAWGLIGVDSDSWRKYGGQRTPQSAYAALGAPSKQEVYEEQVALGNAVPGQTGIAAPAGHVDFSSDEFSPNGRQAAQTPIASMPASKVGGAGASGLGAMAQWTPPTQAVARAARPARAKAANLNVSLEGDTYQVNGPNRAAILREVEKARRSAKDRQNRRLAEILDGVVE